MNEDWKTKRYRYQITLQTGQTVTTDFFDSYQDLENFIRTGAAGFYTPDGFVETPIVQIKAVQPIEEGQASGVQPSGSPEPYKGTGPMPIQHPPADADLGPVSDVPAPPQQAGSVIIPSGDQKSDQPTEGEFPL